MWSAFAYVIIITQAVRFVKRTSAPILPEFSFFTEYCGLHACVKCCIMETEVFTFQNRINFTRAITKGLCYEPIHSIQTPSPTICCLYIVSALSAHADAACCIRAGIRSIWHCYPGQIQAADTLKNIFFHLEQDSAKIIWTERNLH